MPVYDRPIIEHSVREAIAAGVAEISLVLRSGEITDIIASRGD